MDNSDGLARWHLVSLISAKRKSEMGHFGLGRKGKRERAERRKEKKEEGRRKERKGKKR